MELSDQIPSIAELALQYGTISKKQLTQIRHLSTLKGKQGRGVDSGQLLLSHKFATGYQVSLLKLIQEYLIIKKRGQEFGNIAIEKGFATREDVDTALELQKKEFQQAKIRKLIGDILVESRVITLHQKNEVLREQTFLDTQAEKIFDSDLPDSPSIKAPGAPEADIPLSGYEKRFLQIRVLDQDFAASVIEKGFVSVREVKIAQKIQEEEFEKDHKIRIIGQIMVELDLLTEDQMILVLKEQERLDADETGAVGAPIQIRISQDQMEARVELKENAWNIDLENIKKALHDRGIRHGLYPDAILQCNLDMKNTKFLVAKQDFSLELLKSRKAVYHFDTARMDSEIKKKGETLAEQNFGGGTYLKKDLFGNNIAQTRGYDLTFRCTAGTRLSKDKTKAFAGKTGIPSLSIDRKLYIHPFIHVLEDADLRYGPLEAYANLTISGVLTGAYPVTAGELLAGEIRNARIDAIGSVRSRIGITDSTIRAQGDIHAKYVHHCRIETFGNVYIENEIIDSQIFCSGKIDSGQSRTISSTLYGKKGIELAGAGNTRTPPCVLAAGTEHHLLEKARQIDLEIKTVSQQLDTLKEEKTRQDRSVKKIFQKMIELKIFYDRAKEKKEMLGLEFQKKKEGLKKEKRKNISVLITNFEKRMMASLSSLKTLNKTKKKLEKEKILLEKKIKTLEPKIEKKVLDLQTDLFAFFEWTRKQENIPQIKINKTVFPGTLLKGIFSSLEIEKELSNFIAIENQDSQKKFHMVIQKN